MISYSAEHAFVNFINTIGEDIQSPEAIALEADYRLNNLVAIIMSEEWVEDDYGNIFPSILSVDDRQAIADSSRFSIIDSPPRLAGPYTTAFSWQAAGSLISNVSVVVNSPDFATFDLNLRETTIINTQINLNPQ